MRTVSSISPPPHTHLPSIPHFGMDYFDWDFAEAPTADAATPENRAGHDGNPGGNIWIKEVVTDYVYSET